jgi:toxin FitB
MEDGGAKQDSSNVFITAITQAEILLGIEAMPAGKRKRRLAEVVEEIFAHDFQGRILPFDHDAAREFASILASRKAAGRPMSHFDAMIAAIARARRATLATHNTGDFEHCGIRLVNPWTDVH